MAGNSDLVDIDDVKYLRDSKSGLAMEFEKANGSRVWLPKSQCEWDANTKILTCQQWLAEEKGLI